jgi:chromosome segregation protein
MHLKEIVVNGFKSFADRTRIRLQPGVTCIVGPNGCGKSNIVDAVRWVLGEQSAKALRGGKMQDVIFQGTDKRKPHSLCEVSLIFANCEKQLGTAFNEVAITRRVTRDGGSDYFLNGKACRLKDIQQLFMDTGVGQVSYSFMVQGQIDQILSSNPAERRTIFEEAAGITKYKTQRKEALGKLALVDQNLSRVTDVTEEIGRQITSLKRQASKALRYKRVKHRLTHLDLACNAFTFHRRHAEIRTVSVQALRLKESVTSARSALSGREEALEARRAERNTFQSSLREVQQSVFDLRSEKEQSENQADLCHVRAQDIAERIDSLKRECELMRGEHEALMGKLEENVATRQMHLDLVGASDVSFKERSAALEAAQKELFTAETELSQKRQAIDVTSRSMDQLRERCTRCEIDLKTSEAQSEDLAASLKTLEDEYATAEASFREISANVEALESSKTQASEAVEHARGEVARTREAFKAHQVTLQNADRDIARQSAQLQVLEDLQSKLEGFSEGAKAILKGKLTNIIAPEAVTLLSRHFTVDEADAPALETLLGAAVEALALESADEASAAITALRDQQLGRACVQIPMSRAMAQGGTLPDFLKPVSDCVRVDGDAFSNRVLALFSGCFLADSLEGFLDFWKESPAFEFLFVATRAGDLIDSRGLIYGGGGANKKGLIKRETEIRALKQSIQHAEEAFRELQAKAQAHQQACDRAESDLDSAQKAFQEASHRVSSIQAEVRAARDAVQRLEQTLIRSRAQASQLASRKQEASEKRARAQAELSESGSRLDAIRSSIESLESSVSRFRDVAEARREALSDVRVELTEKRQRLEALSSGVSQLEAQKQSLALRLSQRESEIQALGSQVVTFREDTVQYKERSQALAKQLAEKMELLEATRTQVVQSEEAISEIEAGLSDERKKVHDEEIQLNALEIKLAEERSQSRFIEDKIQSEYGEDVTQVDWKWELWQADEPFETKVNLDDIAEEHDLDGPPQGEKRGEPTDEDYAALEANVHWGEIEAEVKILRSKIAAMGAVNLVAIEEYVELRERFGFLTEQVADLTNSKNELLNAIDDINHKSQSLFVDTFEKVRENFKYTFEALFGGGLADLQLSNKEDVLESGIDITARPPGTRLKSLSLLSGGQKTMTAVALLFAIYKVKPSPFCVLDELDAPLDDANIGRFTDMLKTFTAYSQFLVISHNKRTIAAANVLYGVTMQERGVTELVSLRFNDQSGKEVPLSAETDESTALIAESTPDVTPEESSSEAATALVESSL